MKFTNERKIGNLILQLWTSISLFQKEISQSFLVQIKISSYRDEKNMD